MVFIQINNGEDVVGLHEITKEEIDESSFPVYIGIERAMHLPNIRDNGFVYWCTHDVGIVL